MARGDLEMNSSPFCLKQTAGIILSMLFLLATAHAASFDCGKATSEVEKLICGDDELSILDESLNKAYLKALERPDIRKQMIESQRQWLKNERNACKNAECLKKAYETRIDELIRDGSNCGEEPDSDSRGVVEYSHKKEIFSYADGKTNGEDSLTVWNRDAKQMCFSITTVSTNHHTCVLDGKATAVNKNEYSYSRRNCRAFFTFVGDKVKVRMIDSDGTDSCAGDERCGMRGSIDSATYARVRKKRP
jgi:uncharacterized protein